MFCHKFYNIIKKNLFSLGLLHEGDEILEVNGVEMRGKTVNDVCDVLVINSFCSLSLSDFLFCSKIFTIFLLTIFVFPLV